MNKEEQDIKAIETIIRQLKLLSDEHRLTVFEQFCTACGREQGKDEVFCQCWNDE